MQHIRQQAAEAVDAVRSHWQGRPAVGMILGTGLGGLTEQVEVDCRIPYAEIPHFPDSTSPSHAGQLVCGTLHDVPVVAMEGRFHYYEGYSLQQVTFPIRLMRALGAETLLVTSAVGGMNPQLNLADIVILEDHINLLPDNPLRGVNDDELGPRFPDMSEPYSSELVELAQQVALELSVSAHKGVLVAVPGPNLETRAEYRMLRLMGADIVGMSTVPEIIVAKHAGMKTLGFSVVTDMCLPDALEPADIEKILKVAADGGEKLQRLISELFRRFDS
ncbi:purine-nucleoside phosphorylase [Fuerstiella marisgermanici]|uniref:Purine nucleoside phosphorylase n=1 Tax=Fuerstiella marisgermanici TaxID=1891926 RepID=A0A1P8WQ59_9PLAN|nr:purine-nucleoside phosphorylase [Fuerstiella marisgermanici]APZ96197.1 Purine nucleoside phosphorylase 1 [Fuerstiella marisgermanici]